MVYDYLVYGAILVGKYQEVIEVLLILANCGAVVANIIIMRTWMKNREDREAKNLIKLKKYRSTKLGRAYRKAKDDERKMNRRITDRIRRLKKRGENKEHTLKLVA